MCIRGGVQLDTGVLLLRLFLEAGFEAPNLLLTARVEGGPASPVYEYLAELIRSLVPAIVQFGIAAESEIAIDTLAERLRAECLASDGVIVPTMMVGGYAHLRAAAPTQAADP